MSISFTEVFDSARTLHGEHRFGDPEDQIFKHAVTLRALFGSLAKGGRDYDTRTKDFQKVQKMPNRDDIKNFRVRVPVEYQRAGGRTGGWDVHAYHAQEVDIITKASWEVALQDFTITVPKKDYIEAQTFISEGNTDGAVSKLANVLDANYMNGFKTFCEYLQAQLLGTNTSERDQLLSFSAGISDTGTYGGLDKATYTWFAGNVDTSLVLANMLTPGDTSFFRTQFRNAIQTCRRNGAREIVALIASDVFDKYSEGIEGTLDESTGYIGGKHTYAQNDRTGEQIPGFNGYYFANVPVIEEPDLDSGKMLFLDFDTTRPALIPGSIFSDTSWIAMQNASGVQNVITLGAQNLVRNPRRNYELQAS